MEVVLALYCYVFATQQCWQRHCVFRLSRPIRSLVHSSRLILLPRYLMNVLNNSDKNDREYSPAPTDWILKVKGQGHSRLSRWNLVNTISHELLEQTWWNLQEITTRFWRPKVKVLAGLSMWWHRHPCRHSGIEVHLVPIIMMWILPENIIFSVLALVWCHHLVVLRHVM